MGMSFLPISQFHTPSTLNSNVATNPNSANNNSNATSNNKKNATYSHSFQDVFFMWSASPSTSSSPGDLTQSTFAAATGLPILPVEEYLLTDDVWLHHIWQEFYALDTPVVRFHIPEVMLIHENLSSH